MFYNKVRLKTAGYFFYKEFLYMAKRVFLIILDSFGIGGAPDAGKFKDEGSNTLAAVLSYSNDPFPNLSKMGLLSIDGEDDPRITAYKDAQSFIPAPVGSYARVREISAGKDSTIGHWEIAGIISDKPQPTYPDGFPGNVIRDLEKATGRSFLCNKPYSGTDVIRDYGEEHINTGKLIIYTSADSVLQIAAHEEVVPVEELYDICKKAREVMCGDNAVGRIIARPFARSDFLNCLTMPVFATFLPAPSKSSWSGSDAAAILKPSSSPMTTPRTLSHAFVPCAENCSTVSVLSSLMASKSALINLFLSSISTE